jgi:hypothetical protein
MICLNTTFIPTGTWDQTWQASQITGYIWTDDWWNTTTVVGLDSSRLCWRVVQWCRLQIWWTDSRSEVSFCILLLWCLGGGGEWAMSWYTPSCLSYREDGGCNICRNGTASTHDAAKPWRLKLHKRSLLYDKVKHHFALEDLKHLLWGVPCVPLVCHLCCFSPTFSYLSAFVNTLITLHFAPVSSLWDPFEACFCNWTISTCGSLCFLLPFWCWRWRRHIPPKFASTSTRVFGTTLQKKVPLKP